MYSNVLTTLHLQCTSYKWAYNNQFVRIYVHLRTQVALASRLFPVRQKACDDEGEHCGARARQCRLMPINPPPISTATCSSLPSPIRPRLRPKVAHEPVSAEEKVVTPRKSFWRSRGSTATASASRGASPRRSLAKAPVHAKIDSAELVGVPMSFYAQISPERRGKGRAHLALDDQLPDELAGHYGTIDTKGSAPSCPAGTAPSGQRGAGRGARGDSGAWLARGRSVLQVSDTVAAATAYSRGQDQRTLMAPRYCPEDKQAAAGTRRCSRPCRRTVDVRDDSAALPPTAAATQT
ncbi:hypothetical protein FB451DRAFT_323141 [Mycena latifolia]|nr:hypothetical protein FB451DRAFT_323141 [Mycena latifolia]